MEVSSSTCDQLLRQLRQSIEGIKADRGATHTSLEAFYEVSDHSVVTDQNDRSIVYSNLLTRAAQLLNIHAQHAMSHEPEYFAALLPELATVTKDMPLWRRFFGCSGIQHDTYRQTVNAEPDCILEVARRVISVDNAVAVSCIQSALKIIANCCANNNANRRTIVHRDGVELLLRLVENSKEMNTAILTLYNVCIDYDEPATYSVVNPEFSIATTVTDSLLGDNKDTQTSLEGPSMAVEHLAAAYCANDGFATFELLLSCHSKISEHVRPYLAELIEMATEPALIGFEHVRSDGNNSRLPWIWSFEHEGRSLSTIDLMADVSEGDIDCLLHMSQTALNLLSQHVAIDALLKCDGGSIWTLLTLPCQPVGEDADSETDDPLAEHRKAFVKLLYRITGDPGFHQTITCGPSLIERCISELALHTADGKQDEKRLSQERRFDFYSTVITSACVILAQLAASANLVDILRQNQKLTSILVLLLKSEQDPDILYPAITLISRVALDIKPELPLVRAGVPQSMQRLLTAGGLGVIVPLETVIAYKTITRGRAEVVGILLASESDKNSILDDVFTLWTLAMDDNLKLEIGKLYLEVLRTMLPVLQEEDTVPKEEIPLLKQFRSFLTASAHIVTQIFGWMCLKAEPEPQRDHGWFGLAMLSAWTEAGKSMLEGLEQQSDLQTKMLEISQSTGGPVPNNLMLMLSNLRQESWDDASQDTKDVLFRALQNFGLMGANHTRP